jgi:hypothetical protein
VRAGWTSDFQGSFPKYVWGPLDGQLLVHEEVADAICRALRDNGVARQDIEDGRQDVYVKVLVALKNGAAPADVEEMKALCATVAQRHAISALRRATVRIEANLVKWRLHQMRKTYRQRMEKLGLLPNVTVLTVLVSAPGAIDMLRTVA